MKGLLLKDYYLMKDSIWGTLISFVVVGVMLTIFFSPILLIVLAGTMMSLHSTSTIHVDKSTLWHKFSAILPVSKKQIVASKYLSYLALCFIGIALGIIVTLVASLFSGYLNVEEIITNTFLAIFMSFIGGSINIPTTILLSQEKAALSIIITYFSLGAITGLGIYLLVNVFGIDIQQYIFSVSAIAALLSIIIFICSYFLLSNKMIKRDWES